MNITHSILTTSILAASLVTGSAFAEVVINGKTYDAQSSLTVGANGLLTIDGNDVQIDDRIILIQVNGDLDQLNVSSSRQIEVNGTVGFLETKSGNVKVEDVLGDITTKSGSVSASVVTGNVTTTSGNVTYDSKLLKNKESQ